MNKEGIKYRFLTLFLLFFTTVASGQTPDSVGVSSLQMIKSNAPKDIEAVLSPQMQIGQRDSVSIDSMAYAPIIRNEPNLPFEEGSDSLEVRGEESFLDEPNLSFEEGSDSLEVHKKDSFLDDPISGTSQDSLIYDMKNRMVYIYEKGDVTYTTMNIKADFMRIEMDTKQLNAHGRADSTAELGRTRPEFIDDGAAYTLDTVTYNIETKKAKIKGVVTKDGEGLLLGKEVKMMEDKSFHIKDGKYTTCDNPEHPHFYINMTKAKVIPNEKIIAGLSYMVIADVPVPIPIPELFFPMNKDRETGLIMPSYGEDSRRGFYIREGGYYFKFNDYIDLKLLGGIYTLGSWEAAAESRYRVRYKFNGGISANYAQTSVGEEGAADREDSNNFKITWMHSQDPKFRPNSTFSANVNFSTSGYNENASNSLNDYINSQTNSSIAYSKSWAGTPFSMSANVQHSQNSRDTTISLSLPNIVFNMSRIQPFKRKNAVGKERWYEKIYMSYKMSMINKVQTKEYDLFTQQTLKDLEVGVQHTIPISTSFNLFNYINISPSANYNERWYFKKVEEKWDPDLNRRVKADTTFGFYRVYNYNVSLSASTTIYGMYRFKKPESFVQAIRHTLNPSVSISWAPDFSDPKFGFYKPVQSNAEGETTLYSPYAGQVYGVPGSGQSGSIGFSLKQTLEAKIRSKSDTSGMKKLKIIDDFSFSGSYNLLADSMNLSNINLTFRTSIIPNFGITLSATLDPYEFDKETRRRYNKLMILRGIPGRITRTGWSCGYTFKSSDFYDGPVINDASKNMLSVNPFYFDSDNPIDEITRRQMMAASYYDFDIPWNFGFNYSISYTNNGYEKRVTNTFNFNGSLNLSKNWAITFMGGYDFERKELTPMSFTMVRDLHCWQMNFSIVPFGTMKSWSFNISVKSSVLQDLKYEKSASRYDNLYD